MPRKTAVAVPGDEPEEETPEVQDDPQYWTLVLCPPWEGQTRLEYFYDGFVATRNGETQVPKDRAHWASRLVKFENYRFKGYPKGEFPRDFVEAMGGV